MKRILLVDDHQMAREALKQVLEAQGYSIEEAENGAVGLALIQQGRSFDLVISDNQMPVMTGLEFVQRLAQQSYISTHPLILYSGQLTTELEQQVRALGVYAVLQKPYDLQDLLVIVRQAISDSDP
ncbi:response regulator [Candidatus Nitrospira neomarina]|uniref:Response regulator n=1 Tax=Candidatus Nitrospira neomarina TaxID=3020899 RepID=A0AA96K4S8_9BACT|nr:response regulator [Candidatus Nitrospira neomarina]WNM63659.1 response regulator [Candidatus Nitrospira neomarina]